MSEPMGIDMPEFQLSTDRREYLKKHGTLIKSTDKLGKTTYSVPLEPTSFIDDDGVMIYVGRDEVVRRESGMCVIEQTPQWILRAIMQHARGAYSHREGAVWPETVWSVSYGIRQVLILNKVDDSVMDVKLRKLLVNEASPLISRFLIRENPEYGKTHFIGIRRRLIKKASENDDSKQMELPIEEQKKKEVVYTLDDYLFPELRGLTADAVTMPDMPTIDVTNGDK